MEVIIKPEEALPHDCRLGIFDFINSTQIEGLGSDLAQQVNQRLLQAHLFQLIELVDKNVVSLDHALSIGREQGYDLILVGEVKDFLHGGLSADSRVALSIRIIDP